MYYNGHDTNPFPLTYPAAPAVPATGLANNRFYRCDARRSAGSRFPLLYGIGKNPANTNTVDFEMASGGLGYQFNSRFSVTSGYYYLKDRNHSANH